MYHYTCGGCILYCGDTVVIFVNRRTQKTTITSTIYHVYLFIEKSVPMYLQI